MYFLQIFPLIKWPTPTQPLARAKSCFTLSPNSSYGHFSPGVLSATSKGVCISKVKILLISLITVSALKHNHCYTSPSTIVQLGVGGVPTFHVRLLLQLFHSLTTVYCEVNRNCLLWGLCSSIAHLIIQWLTETLTESDFDVSEITSNKKNCVVKYYSEHPSPKDYFCSHFHKYLVNRIPATVFHLRTIVRLLVLPIWHWISNVLTQVLLHPM